MLHCFLFEIMNLRAHWDFKNMVFNQHNINFSSSGAEKSIHGEASLYIGVKRMSPQLMMVIKLKTQSLLGK